MIAPPRVLIVDRSPESREVLRTLVQRVGAEAIEVDRLVDAMSLTTNSPPSLILFDADNDGGDYQAPLMDLQATAGRTDTPIVVLGTKRRGKAAATGQFVAKPYHYGPLVRRITDLLAARRAA